MKLSNRLKRIEVQLLPKWDDETYIFVRSEAQGGPLTLHGEEGKRLWESTMTPDLTVIKNGNITVRRPRFPTDIEEVTA